MLETLKKLFIHKPKEQKHIKILVVEDSPVDMKVAVKAVERGGYSVLTATDGKQGLELAKKHQPDLIILDYQLPDIKGTELCLQLKHITPTANIPVLFLTGQDSDANVLDCFDKGAENYLSKPISPALLLKYINDILKDREENKNV